jgi:hypothetical protein
MTKKPPSFFFGLLLVVVIAGLGSGTCYLSRSVVHEPAEVLALAQEIFPIHVPAELQPRVGWDRLGFRFASFKHKSGDQINELLIASVPETDAQETDQSWSILSEENSKAKEIQMTEDGTFEVVVGGTAYPAMVSIGSNAEGQSYRAIRLRIPAGAGSIEVFRLGPTEQVTQENFIAMIPGS